MDYSKDDNGLDTRRQQDRDDLQNEVAGRETGRMKKFLTADGSDTNAEKKRRKDRAFQDALERLLATDLEYRALYEALGDRLGSAEVEADEAIAALRVEIDNLDTLINDMRDQAARLPDGRPVFRHADGRVVDENGDAIAPELAEGVIWPTDAPSAEDYFAATDKRAALWDLMGQWEAYRNDTLGGIRDRYDDRNDPMSKDDLKDALDQIETVRPKSISFEQDLIVRERAAPVTQAKAFPVIKN